MVDKAAFVQQMYQEGVKAGLTDAAARVMAAQAAIESGYGERAPGYNFFAITQGKDWNGSVIARIDKDANGNPFEQKFRAYTSREAGIADRVAFMDQKFPGFNKAKTVDEALGVLQHGVLGKYYEAPQHKYEAAVRGIESKYMAGPATAVEATAQMAGASDLTGFLSDRAYYRATGGMGAVNAERMNPEFSARLAALMTAAEAETGTQARIMEGYRAPEIQAQYRANYINSPIVYKGKTYSPNGATSGKAAPPGNSEHQLGMAADFADTPARTWMMKHAEDYGLHWFGNSDPGHFEIPPAEYQAALKGTPLQTIGATALKAAREGIGLPPLDIPETAVGTETSTSPTAPVPRNRPAILSAPASAYSAAAAKAIRGNASMGVRSAAGLAFPDDFAKGGLGVGTYGLGGVSDDRTAAMLRSQDATLDPVGEGPQSWFGIQVLDDQDEPSGGLSFPVPMPGRPYFPPQAPVPMPGRPADKAKAAATSEPAATAKPMSKEERHRRLMQQQSPDPNRNTGGTVVSGIIGQVIGDAVSKVELPVLDADAAKAALTHNALQLGDNARSTAKGGVDAVIGFFSGLKPKTPIERLSAVAHSAYGPNGGAMLSGADLGDEVVEARQITPTPQRAPQIEPWKTPFRYTQKPLGLSVAPQFAGIAAAFDKHFAITAEETRGEQAQARQAKPGPVSTQTVKSNGVVVDKPAAAAPVVKPAAKPIYTPDVVRAPAPIKGATKLITEEAPNPAYAAYERTRQASSSVVAPVPAVEKLQDIHDRNDATIVKAQTSTKPPLTAPPSKTITVTRRVPVAATAPRTQATPAPSAKGRSGGQSEGVVVRTVKIASGKTVPVGAMGTAQGGRYVYQVQADGSVKNLTTGRITAPATK